MEQESGSSNDERPLQYLHHKEEIVNRKPWITPVMVEGKPLDMEIDTGASVSLISESMYHQLWKKQLPSIQASSTVLRTYTGEQIPLLGRIIVRASTRRGVSGVTFTGSKRQWPKSLWSRLAESVGNELAAIHQALRIDIKELDSVLQQYEVFRDELGHLKDVEVKIHVDAQAAPWFFRARNVLHAFREQVEEELFNLVRSGSMEP